MGPLGNFGETDKNRTQLSAVPVVTRYLCKHKFADWLDPSNVYNINKFSIPNIPKRFLAGFWAPFEIF